ncbi:MAG: sialate O-acetylesterase [Mobilitalea sp.]
MTKFKVAAIFSSNMVLQRNKNIKVFGQGEDLKQITVSFLGENYLTQVKNQEWVVILPPTSATTGCTMTVSCEKEEKKFENIAVGEVWLAGGQSNMEFELNHCTGGEEMLKNDKNPNVRYYHTNRIAYIDEDFYEQEEKSQWKEFNEENAAAWSAVGYIFGKKLAAELGVTVGIIGCNWGGTSACCWMNKDSLQEDRELDSYLEEYQEAFEVKSLEEQRAEYQEYQRYHEDWEKKCAKVYEENPDTSWTEAIESCGECKWPGPMNSINPFRPSGLYECMLQRITPYTLAGFIYYQGESDDHKPQMYQKLLTRMIKQWREDWEEDNLPFLIVQLPMHRNKEDEDKKNWCLIREAQMNTYRTIKNTGIAIILDCGEFNEIHPKNKMPVGERLALQALYQVYHKVKEEEAFGPMYRSLEYKDGGIELSFDYAEDGFVVKNEIKGFEIAGEDNKFIDADVIIKGSKMFVSSKVINNPVALRYCWTNYSEVTVYGGNGIPLAPFRDGLN